jgi:hypothetical protein
MTIAVLAVILSLISSFGDDAKTNAIIKTDEASNKWGYFQSKSIKEHMLKATLDLASLTDGGSTDERARISRNLGDEIERYGGEKEAIQKEAQALQAEAALNMRIDNRCGTAELLLEVSIVLASVAILARWKLMWVSGTLLGMAGSLIGLSARLM